MSKKLFLLIVLFCSCFLSIQAQKKEAETTNKKTMKPKFTGKSTENTTSPNTIWVMGKLVSTVTSRKDCNNQAANFIEFKIEKIITSGHAVISIPATNKKYSFIIPDSLKDKFKNKSSEKLKLIITENLCMNNLETTYKVLSFVPKN